MSSLPHILAIGGSLRRGSYNQQLVQVVAEGARSAGAEVTVVALADFPMPVFDEDLEKVEGKPASAVRLKSLFAAHHGMVIASPEYNSSISGALKNALDWISRGDPEDDKPLAAFAGKSAALCAASPGALGGLRGLVHVRAILGNLGTLVLPDQVTIPHADSAFAADGSLGEARLAERSRALGVALASHLRKILA